MPEKLSQVERRILKYLADYVRQNTYQPSVREIGLRFAIKSTKTVSEHLQALADKGYIDRHPSRSRGVRIRGLDLRRTPVRVPLYGKIAAGEPMLLDIHVEDEYRLDPELVPSPDCFLLRVIGDSMQGVGILDGDLVLVEPDDEGEIDDGEVIAARVGGEATVKRYFGGEHEVVLEPANPEFAPIVVGDREDFAVLGRVAGLVRRFARPPAEPSGA